MSKKINYDTTILIKLPSELKGAFKGLCDAKGVGVSEELRRFMSDAVVESTMGMATVITTNITPKTIPVRKNTKALSKETVRCSDTPDMFSKKLQNASQATKSKKSGSNTKNNKKRSHGANKTRYTRKKK